MAAYQGAMHSAADGWCGIPAPAFRNACVSACRMCGFKMTHAKLSLFIEPDGFDADDGTPLVRITQGDRSTARWPSATSRRLDLRPRSMWREGWEAIVRVRFDADQFTLRDVANLLLRAGCRWASARAARQPRQLRHGLGTLPTGQ